MHVDIQTPESYGKHCWPITCLFLLSAPRTIPRCGLMLSVKFLQHHAEFHMGLHTKIDALSAVAQIASRYLTNCCPVNAYQISAGNLTSF